MSGRPGCTGPLHHGPINVHAGVEPEARSIAQTIWDAGRRRANLEITQSGYDAAVADYRQTTLDAFQQVEDNLAALRVLSEEAETQRAAVAAAQRSVQLSLNRYQGGLVTYLEVSTTQSTALANERTAVDIQRRRMDASVLLIKALGGGWDAHSLPTQVELTGAKPKS